MRKGIIISSSYPRVIAHALLWQMVLDFKFNDKAFSLTHCILMDSSTVICWTSAFVTLGVSGLFCHFYSVLDGKSC